MHCNLILKTILLSNHQNLQSTEGIRQFCVALASPFVPDDGVANNKKLVLIAELALVLAGVFVFRGLWMLLDSVEFMHTPIALWLSLFVGSGVTVWAIRCLMKQEDQ
jgi:hypothetical protein